MFSRMITGLALGTAMMATPLAEAGKRITETVSDGDLGINAQLEAMDAPVRLSMAEFIVADGSEYAGGKIVFYKDTGNKQLSNHYVKGDPRRGGFSDISFITDMVDGAATGAGGGVVDPFTTTSLIEEGMDAWDGISCSAIPLNNLGGYFFDMGYVQYLVSGGAQDRVSTH